MDKKIEFLYHAIDDAQELIKFIDSKTAFIIGILGAFFVSIFAALEDLIRYSSKYSSLFWILVALFIILITICVVITKQIIRPLKDPSKNIIFGEESIPSLLYYIAPNNYQCENIAKNFRNHYKYKLTTKLPEFLATISTATDTDLIKCLSYELLKVSYIRNLKSDRFNGLVNSLIITTALFLIVVVLFFLERQNIRVLTKR